MNPARSSLATMTAWLTLAIITPAAIRATSEAGTPLHRVLFRYQTTYGDSFSVTYWVRVEQFLSVTDMQTLACAIVAEEKPKDYGRLWIQFNYRLDSYNLVPTEEYSQSSLGHYAWADGLGGSPYSLARWRDQHGARLPRGAQFSSFDHTKECPLKVESGEGEHSSGPDQPE